MSNSNFEYRPPLKPKQSLKSKTTHGSFSTSWWGEKWIASLERLMDAGRLRRGRKYARKGQVMSISEEAVGISARVQGARTTPYIVSISFEPFTNEAWERVIEVMKLNALFSAELLSGTMPDDIEEAFLKVGVSLFPVHADEVHVTCSCPDWADVCKHAAATHLLLAERFDEDPFLLFRLRGRDQKTIMDALMGRQEDDQQAQKDRGDLAKHMDVFWSGEKLEEPLSLNIQPPEIDMALLRQLGPPDFTDADFIATLAPVYKSITQAGRRIVTGEQTDQQG